MQSVHLTVDGYISIFYLSLSQTELDILKFIITPYNFNYCYEKKASDSLYLLQKRSFKDEF